MSEWAKVSFACLTQLTNLGHSMKELASKFFERTFLPVIEIMAILYIVLGGFLVRTFLVIM